MGHREILLRQPNQPHRAQPELHRRQRRSCGPTVAASRTQRRNLPGAAPIVEASPSERSTCTPPCDCRSTESGAESTEMPPRAACCAAVVGMVGSSAQLCAIKDKTNGRICFPATIPPQHRSRTDQGRFRCVQMASKLCRKFQNTRLARATRRAKLTATSRFGSVWLELIALLCPFPASCWVRWNLSRSTVSCALHQPRQGQNKRCADGVAYATLNPERETQWSRQDSDFCTGFGHRFGSR